MRGVRICPGCRGEKERRGHSLPARTPAWRDWLLPYSGAFKPGLDLMLYGLIFFIFLMSSWTEWKASPIPSDLSSFFWNHILFLILPSGACRSCFLARNLKLLGDGLEVFGARSEGELCTKPLLCYMLLCVYVWQVIWGWFAMEFWDPKSIPWGCFLAKTLLLGTTWKSWCCYHYSFERWLKSYRELQVLLLPSFQKHNTPSPPLASPLWLGQGATLSSKTRFLNHCAICPLGSQKALED